MAETISRAAHLKWCKDRALAYADRGDNQNALASMSSDLRKHPETDGHQAVELGMLMMLAGQLKQPGEMRRFIEGVH